MVTALRIVVLAYHLACVAGLVCAALLVWAGLDDIAARMRRVRG